MLLLAPNSAPDNFTAEALSPTIILVNWEPLPPINRNGDIMYVITSSPLNNFGGTYEDIVINVDTTNFTIMNLQESVRFNISVAAFTSVGVGPSSCVLTSTLEAGINLCGHDIINVLVKLLL